MQWYYAREGRQHGPVGEMDLRELIEAGTLTGENLVWRDGMGDWQAIRNLPELETALEPATAPVEVAEVEASPYRPPSSTVAPGAGTHVPNYLWQSIVVTILCSPIFGILAILNAVKVERLKREGDAIGAAEASRKAKMWCWVSVGVSIVATVLIFMMGGFSQPQSP